MPRAYRHILPGQVWHLTHRCHKKQWLLKFARDRRRWLYWLFEARRRYGLVILNYVVTSNHIHLLVKDRGRGEIGRSMQLISGRTAQEYNQRKNRNGAFWEDRYHSTAVEADDHLHRCITYIDMNMVRAGVVKHPAQWEHGAFSEAISPRNRYKTVDYETLLKLLCLSSLEQLKETRAKWIIDQLASGLQDRDPAWTEGIAVGSESYVVALQTQLKASHPGRKVSAVSDLYTLQEPQQPVYAVDLSLVVKPHFQGRKRRLKQFLRL